MTGSPGIEFRFSVPVRSFFIVGSAAGIMKVMLILPPWLLRIPYRCLRIHAPSGLMLRPSDHAEARRLQPVTGFNEIVTMPYVSVFQCLMCPDP